MPGIRIYELARELGVANKVLIELLGNMGYPVKSHSSSIEHNLADRLRRQIKQLKLEGSVVTKKKKAAKAAEAKPVAEKPTAAKPAAKQATKPTAAKPAVAKAAAKLTPKKVEAKTPTKAKEKPPEDKKVKEPNKAKEVEDKAAMEAARIAKEEAIKKVKEESEKKKEVEARRNEAERKKRQEDKRQKEEARKQEEAARKKRAESKKRKAEEERKRREAHAKKKAEAEKKRRIEDERKRKQEEEEREIQRLIDDEEKAKQEEEANRIIIDEATTVKEFAEKLRMGVNDIIRQLMGKGIMATLNQTIDVDVAKEMALELGYELKTREEEEEEKEVFEEEDSDSLIHRPPVVTIMGHVDHGKTSLLDTIRKTSVTEEEAGGITQRIGAYKVNLENGTVVFLDTPGHEAFTAMRARGASVTDLVVLVVAADDGVMPQTLEAIHHAKAADVPLLVAVNKIDKPGANPDRVKQELASNDVLAEDWGGNTIFCEVSAKQNTGIESLLEMLLLQAEVLDLKANPARMAHGSIIESKLDRGRGPVATVLVQRGTLNVGDTFVAGMHYGKVRALIDDQHQKVESAGPSIPVEVLGFSGVPSAGESFLVVENERKAHQIALKRQDTARLEGLTARGHVKLENLHAQITKGAIKDLNIIVKADVQGSIEAVRQAMGDIQLQNIRINLLHGAVGGITETDISLAAASDAIVIGFNVRPTEKANLLAEEEDVDVRLYSVIYNAIDDIKQAVEGMLEPEYKEVVLGRAEVRNTFTITKVGTIAGSYITSGQIKRNSDARLIRDSVVIHTGKVGSLRRFKDDVKEVANGYECGIGLDKYNDIKVSDIIETFMMEEIDRKS